MSKEKRTQWQLAYETWPVLVEAAQAKRTISYKELSERIDHPARFLRQPLDCIQNYCLCEKLPPLTILPVNQSGKPSEGFIAWDVDDLEAGLQLVYNFHWSENPFSFAASGETPETLAERLMQNPADAEDVYVLVKTRAGAQDVFRELMLRAYGNKCAITGSGIVEGLEAAHIHPWAVCEKKDRLDPRNGLLLTAWHHKLFDAGILTLDEKYCIRVDPTKLKTDFDCEALENLDGEKLKLPKEKRLWPDKKLIRQRNELGANKLKEAAAS